MADSSGVDPSKIARDLIDAAGLARAALDRSAQPSETELQRAARSLADSLERFANNDDIWERLVAGDLAMRQLTAEERSVLSPLVGTPWAVHLAATPAGSAVSVSEHATEFLLGISGIVGGLVGVNMGRARAAVRSTASHLRALAQEADEPLTKARINWFISTLRRAVSMAWRAAIVAATTGGLGVVVAQIDLSGIPAGLTHVVGNAISAAVAVVLARMLPKEAAELVHDRPHVARSQLTYRCRTEATIELLANLRSAEWVRQASQDTLGTAHKHISELAAWAFGAAYGMPADNERGFDVSVDLAQGLVVLAAVSNPNAPNAEQVVSVSEEVVESVDRYLAYEQNEDQRRREVQSERRKQGRGTGIRP